eukprot:11619339-Karenia_brevis.AAC.1
MTKYGFTLGCRGCDNIRRGGTVAMNHSRSCRERVEKLIGESGNADSPGEDEMQDASSSPAGNAPPPMESSGGTQDERPAKKFRTTEVCQPFQKRRSASSEGEGDATEHQPKRSRPTGQSQAASSSSGD